MTEPERRSILSVLRKLIHIIRLIRGLPAVERRRGSLIHLNYRDARPIYEQIKDGMRRLVVTGVMPAGEKLPSVRELAAELAINPNTISRAYRELEAEGYIYTASGKGSFVSDKAEVDERRKAELMARLKELAAELRFLGATVEELRAAVAEEEGDI